MGLAPLPRPRAPGAMMRAMPHDHDHDHAHDHHHAHDGDESLRDAYAAAVAAYRADKDEAFRHDPQSPLAPGDREGFEGLRYFPADPGMVIDGLELLPYEGDAPELFDMQTTTGVIRPAMRAGVLRFELSGTPCELVAYDFVGVPSETLFLPFLDATSGADTYGAGRYLDVAPEPDGTWTLDFNLAYHPLCAYDARWSCPLTPAENRLPIRVEAGERL